MCTHRLEADYRGARLELEIHPGRQVRLLVNGIAREEVFATGNHIRVTSTVQTDYEWHEFIEGRVDFGPDQVTASLLANNASVAQETFALAED